MGLRTPNCTRVCTVRRFPSLAYAPQCRDSPAVGSVGCAGGEKRLVRQRFPADNRIAWKSQSGSDGCRNHPNGRRSPDVFFLLEPGRDSEDDLTTREDPGRGSWYSGPAASRSTRNQPPVLPAGAAIRQNRHAQTVDCQYQRDGFYAGGIQPQGACGAGIGFFVWVNALSRMQVEGGRQLLFVQPGKQGGRVGEQVSVPGEAGPATAGVAGLGDVPVHINNQR